MYRFVNGNLFHIFDGFALRNRDKYLYQYHVRVADELYVQWNLSTTTTSIMKFSACDLFSNVFNEDGRY